jgi:hypothetical protein
LFLSKSLFRATTPQSTTQKVACPNVTEFSETREKALFLMAFFLNLMSVKPELGNETFQLLKTKGHCYQMTELVELEYLSPCNC